MKILLFGKNGQVGRRLLSCLLPIGTVIAYGSNDINFMELEKLRSCIKLHKPDIIINAAAYTNVDKAELEITEAFTINAEAVKVIAEEATAIGALLIHYSSEYVFDGTKSTFYTELDTPNPVNIYGKSKLAGDNYIASIASKYIIFRTSWVYDSYGKNFAKTILTLAKDKDILKIINDQIGAPTNASLIANVTAYILYKLSSNGLTTVHKYNGIYNLTASGQTSWHGFACELVKFAQSLGIELIPINNIIPIPTEEYITPATRPKNSKLDTCKLTNEFNLVLPEWKIYIPLLIGELKLMNVI